MIFRRLTRQPDAAIRAETETLIAASGETAIERGSPHAIMGEITHAAPEPEAAIAEPAEAEASRPVEAHADDIGSPATTSASTETPASQGQSPAPALTENAAAAPPRATLIPFIAAADKPARLGATGRPGADWRLKAGVAAACLTLVVAVAGAATLAQATKSQSESQNLAQAVSAVAARIDAVEAARPREEATEIRKAVTEARGGLATARDVTATVAQLNARLDRLEHEQEARLEKLGERVDHDAAARSTEAQAHSADLASRIERLERADLAGQIDKIEKADFAARIDKIEKKAATQTIAATSPPTPPARDTTTVAASPGVSNEITGSIERPHPTAPIRGWVLAEMRNGAAVVENHQGLRQVTPGDVLPGAGKIERFEKRGHEWVVVTDEGVIVEASAGTYAPHVVARPPMYGPYNGFGPGSYGAYGED